MLCYAMLCYAILYYITLYYIILYYYIMIYLRGPLLRARHRRPGAGRHARQGGYKQSYIKRT